MLDQLTLGSLYRRDHRRSRNDTGFKSKAPLGLWISLPSSKLFLFSLAGRCTSVDGAALLPAGCMFVAVLVMSSCVSLCHDEAASISSRKRSRKQMRKRKLGGREERFRFRMSERKVEQEMQLHDRGESGLKLPSLVLSLRSEANLSTDSYMSIEHSTIF